MTNVPRLVRLAAFGIVMILIAFVMRITNAPSSGLAANTLLDQTSAFQASLSETSISSVNSAAWRSQTTWEAIQHDTLVVIRSSSARMKTNFVHLVTSWLQDVPHAFVLSDQDANIKIGPNTHRAVNGSIFAKYNRFEGLMLLPSPSPPSKLSLGSKGNRKKANNNKPSEGQLPSR
jgi:hypothetical protein